MPSKLITLKNLSKSVGLTISATKKILKEGGILDSENLPTSEWLEKTEISTYDGDYGEAVQVKYNVEAIYSFLKERGVHKLDDTKKSCIVTSWYNVKNPILIATEIILDKLKRAGETDPDKYGMIAYSDEMTSLTFPGISGEYEKVHATIANHFQRFIKETPKSIERAKRDPNFKFAIQSLRSFLTRRPQAKKCNEYFEMLETLESLYPEADKALAKKRAQQAERRANKNAPLESHLDLRQALKFIASGLNWASKKINPDGPPIEQAQFLLKKDPLDPKFREEDSEAKLVFLSIEYILEATENVSGPVAYAFYNKQFLVTYEKLVTYAKHKLRGEASKAFQSSLRLMELVHKVYEELYQRTSKELCPEQHAGREAPIKLKAHVEVPQMPAQIPVEEIQKWAKFATQVARQNSGPVNSIADMIHLARGIHDEKEFYNYAVKVFTSSNDPEKQELWEEMARL